jgi:hypothetical protein
MPDALGFDSQRELIEYPLGAVTIDGHYLEFGVFTGGTIRFIARRSGQRVIHGLDSFKGLPEAWSGFNITRGAFRPRRTRAARTEKRSASPRLFRGKPADMAAQQSRPRRLCAPRLRPVQLHQDCGELDRRASPAELSFYLTSISTTRIGNVTSLSRSRIFAGTQCQIRLFGVRTPAGGRSRSIGRRRRCGAMSPLSAVDLRSPPRRRYASARPRASSAP